MRTLVVGDIHGGLKGLKQVLERVVPSSGDTFIFVGDYVDGWSESAATISFLMEFATSNTCVFIKGNHDELLLEYLETGKARPMWLASGGAASQQSYAELNEHELMQHKTFLNSLKYYHVDAQNRLYLHAGFTNPHGPQHEFYPNMVYWDRTLWEVACSLDPTIETGSALYPKRLKLFKEIFIGHTPVTRIGYNIPVAKANVWNVDTGAAFRGQVSILDADSKAYWQSDPVHTLYPNERGRN